MLNALIIVACVVIGLFLLTLVMYFFNLDMKASGLIGPLLTKHYDRIKRDRRL